VINLKNGDSKIINDFLKRKTSKEQTRKTYRTILNKYFKIIGIRDIDNYFSSKRNYVEDVWTFADAIQHSPPKSQQTYLACIKSFLERYDIELKKREWGDIKTRNGLRNVRPLRQKRTPNNADVKAILSYGGIKSRALFVFACTTGMRINEVLSLTFADIDMDMRHVRIRQETSKGNIPRDTFFSQESKELLEKWLPERQRYLLRSYKKSLYVRQYYQRRGYEVKFEDTFWNVYKDGKKLTKEQLIEMDPRLFPFEYTNALKIWHNLLEKAGSPYNQKDGNYYLFNIHSLRRFWFTQLESAGANMYHINYMGGHESELNATYTDFELRDLKKSYDDKMNFLSIFSEMKDVEKVITPKLMEQETQISILSREYQKVSSDFEQFKKLVYYSIGVPPYSDEQLRQRKDLEGFLPKVTEEELKFINAFRDRPYKKKSKANQS